MIGGLLLLGCFLAGTSFAYRWIFALWLAPWLWSQATRGANRGIAKLALVALAVSLWQDGLFCTTVHLWLPTIGPTVETAWRRLTQPINWILMSLIAGWLFEAALSMIRELKSSGSARPERLHPQPAESRP